MSEVRLWASSNIIQCYANELIVLTRLQMSAEKNSDKDDDDETAEKIWLKLNKDKIMIS